MSKITIELSTDEYIILLNYKRNGIYYYIKVMKNV